MTMPTGEHRPVAADEVAANPEVLIDRLRSARRSRGLTQQQAADALGLARTTVVAIEKGERPVRAGELVQLAELYGKPVGELLRPLAPPVDFIAQFRLRGADAENTSGNSELIGAVDSLQQLADDYVELERIANSPLPQRYQPEADVSGLTPNAAGEALAHTERQRLGLGDAPVLQLRQLLEGDVGIRIFAVELPPKVAGLFVASPSYGACIAINASHPGERQRWSLAHEYAHFLAQRDRSEVTVLHGYRRVPADERFADAFAENFLMPEQGLKRRFHEVRLARPSGVTPADLLHLADLFQVSLEALVRRLENLDLVRSHTWDRLLKQGFRVGEARELLELAALPPDTDLLPLRYRYMAVEAYLQGAISEGQFARFIRLDRAAARQMAQRLSHRVALDASGSLDSLGIDLAEMSDTEDN